MLIIADLTTLNHFLSVGLSHTYLYNKYFKGLPVEITEKPVLNGHSKRRPNIGFQDRLSLNAGQSIAECSKRAFCFIFDLH